MTFEQFSILITNSTEIVMVAMAFFSALFAGIQAFMVFKAYEIAKNFENEHKRRGEIDREQKFAEKILELLKKIDSEMDDLFDKKILLSEEGKIENQKLNEITDPYILLGHNIIRYYYQRHLIVKLNKTEKWRNILSFSRDLELYIGYFDDKIMSQNKARLIFASKHLIEWIVETFPKLASQNFDSEQEYLAHFQKNIVLIFPDTMVVKSPFVDNYQKYRDRLANQIFLILKSNKSPS